MATKSAMVANVRQLTGEQSTKRYSDSYIGDLVARGYARVCRATGCMTSAPISANSVQGQARYKLSGFGSGAGARIFALKGAWYDSAKLYIRDWDTFQRKYPTWPFASNGRPSEVVFYDANTLMLYPVPDTAGKAITIVGSTTPDLTAFTNNSVPEFHEDWHCLIEYHAAATLECGIIDEQAAAWRENRFGQLFWAGLLEMRHTLAHSAGVPRLGQRTEPGREFWLEYEFGEPIS